MQHDPTGPQSLALPSTRSLIGGRRVRGERMIAVHDRYTQAPAVDVHEATRAQVAQAVGVARAAVGSSPPPCERARILQRVGALIAERRAQFVDLLALEGDSADNDLAVAAARLRSVPQGPRLHFSTSPIHGNLSST